MPQWRGDEQALAIHRHSEHGKDSHMASSLEFGCHIGTHIDAPLHFLAGAPGVDELPLEAFGGAALVLDVRRAVEKLVAVEGGPLILGLCGRRRRCCRGYRCVGRLFWRHRRGRRRGRDHLNSLAGHAVAARSTGF